MNKEWQHVIFTDKHSSSFMKFWLLLQPSQIEFMTFILPVIPCFTEKYLFFQIIREKEQIHFSVNFLPFRMTTKQKVVICF